LKSNFIDNCPGNGYKCDQTYKISKDQKLVGFEYELPKHHWALFEGNKLLLPDIKPIIIARKNM
jgi:hypothetical protein